jgi:hypothetical protein
MPWDTKYSNYGVIKTGKNNVKVYSERNNFITIALSEDIASALWAGGELNITLKTGKVRRYKDRMNYLTI